MATTHWKCFHGSCNYIGLTDEFEGEGHQCPRCGSEDVFPYRRFRCENCGVEEELPGLVGENMDLDPDPVEEGWNTCECRYCHSPRLVQIDEAGRVIGRLPVPKSEQVSVDESIPAPTVDWKTRRRVMARSYLKELRDNGLTNQQIIDLANYLLDLTRSDLDRKSG